MSNTYIDIKMTQQVDGTFDFAIDSSGKIILDDGFDTTIYTSLLTDQRASAQQVSNPLYRRGWLGDVTDSENRKLGSLLWLLEQRRLTQATLNEAKDHTEKALSWMIDDKIASEINVSADFGDDAIQIDISASISIKKSEIANKFISIWLKTGV